MGIINRGNKKYRFTKKKIIVLIVVVGILVTGISAYLYYTSIYWDGGKWENTITIPSNGKGYSGPIFIEYQGLIYGFFSFTSKSTYTRSDAITPDQYSLSDIVYRTFDGVNWGSEHLLSDLNDETTESITDAVIYNDRIYVVRYKNTREVINDDESDWDNIIWNTSILLQSFDGKNWEDYGSIILSEEMGERCGSPDLIVWNDKIWAVWKTDVYYEYNQYSFKSFDGNNWTQIWNFSMPSPNSNGCIFYVYNNELWATWWCSVSKGIAHADIYLGKFNGTMMELMAKMTEGENNEHTCRPHLSVYNGKIFVAWEGGAGILCRPFYNGKLGETMQVDYGMQVFTIVYKDKLYLLFQESGILGEPNFYIKSYDGNKWSNGFKFTSWSYPGSDYPKAFTFNEKLYVYWESWSGGKNYIAIKEYER